MRASSLRDGVVAVAHENAVVEGAGLFQRVAVVRRAPAEEPPGEALLADELVEEDAPQALRGPAVAREERPRDFLREFQAEDWRVDVREEGGERLRLLILSLIHISEPTRPY